MIILANSGSLSILLAFIGFFISIAAPFFIIIERQHAHIKYLHSENIILRSFGKLIALLTKIIFITIKINIALFILGGIKLLCSVLL